VARKIHVVPVGGEEPVHHCYFPCWCSPLETADHLVIHHAEDLREVQERHGTADPKKKWQVIEVDLIEA
jgi:hypothetical protein